MTVGGLVFTAKWGEPLYPDTVTALMNKLLTAHNESVKLRGRHFRTPACMTCATCTPPVSWLVSRYMSSLPGSATPIQPPLTHLRRA